MFNFISSLFNTIFLVTQRIFNINIIPNIYFTAPTIPAIRLDIQAIPVVRLDITEAKDPEFKCNYKEMKDRLEVCHLINDYNEVNLKNFKSVRNDFTKLYKELGAKPIDNEYLSSLILKAVINESSKKVIDYLFEQLFINNSKRMCADRVIITASQPDISTKSLNGQKIGLEKLERLTDSQFAIITGRNRTFHSIHAAINDTVDLNREPFLAPLSSLIADYTVPSWVEFASVTVTIREDNKTPLMLTCEQQTAQSRNSAPATFGTSVDLLSTSSSSISAGAAISYTAMIKDERIKNELFELK
jgi:hypothetical protein